MPTSHGIANEVLLDKASVFLNEKGAESGSLGHELAMALSGAASGALGGAVAGDASIGASVGAATQQYGYYGYRDSLGPVESELSQLLSEFAQENLDLGQTHLMP